jgi:diguanylate cyclase (GGDEF)-like protein/PAS domain S-box-containing protein
LKALEKGDDTAKLPTGKPPNENRARNAVLRRSQRARDSPPSTSSQTVHILLVEDSPSDADFLKEILSQSQSHYVVTCVDRIGLATAVLKGPTPVDLVLLDFSLPDSEGIGTFEKIQAVASRLPIIVLTSTRDNDLASLAVSKGAQDYLIKWEVDLDLMERSIRYAVARKSAEEALRESEERYALAVQGANDGLWDWDLRSDRIYFSPRYAAMLGWDEDSYPTRAADWFATIHSEDLPVVQEAITAHLEGGTPHFAIEYRSRHRDGSYLWILARALAIRDQAGRPYRMAGSLTDITGRKRVEEELAYSAFHDPLTGLPNRALFLDRLGQLMAQSRRRAGYSYAVFFLDLDRFKNINDSLGHNIGDRLLITIAHSLQAFVRHGDTIARLGGDEFAMLANDVNGEPDLSKIAERLLDRLRSPYRVGEHEIFTSASVGIAAGASHYKHPDEILRDADTAMYRAKARGKACYELFDGTMHHRAVALLALETDLRRALDRNEFLIQFQPIVDMRKGRVHSFEALVRWQHPTRGLLQPRDFIAVAEETGIIVPIGIWVLTEACRHAHEWQKYYPAAVSVNLSPRELQQANIVETVAGIIQSTKITPSTLILELTEGALSEDPAGVGEKLVRLRALGVKVYIDDFGTGYSSLSHLQRLPCDTLKIDRSFVGRLGTEKGSREIVHAIVSLARNLGMHVVAEGIETKQQLEALLKLGCELGQGFWFSAPLEPQAVLALIQKENA